MTDTGYGGPEPDQIWTSASSDYRDQSAIAAAV